MKNITAACIRQVTCTGVTVNVLGVKMPNTDTLRLNDYCDTCGGGSSECEHYQSKPHFVTGTNTLDDILKRFAADLDDAMEYNPTEEKVNRAITKAKAALLQRERDIRIDELKLHPQPKDVDGTPVDHLSAVYRANRIAQLQAQSSKGGE